MAGSDSWPLPRLSQTPGTRVSISCGWCAFTSAIRAAASALMLAGTSREASARRSLVTTISSIAPACRLGAPARNAAQAKADDNVNARFSIGGDSARVAPL